MKVWSEVAIDYSKGLTKSSDGQLIPNKIGAYVDSYEDAIEWQKNWEKRHHKV
jgi:hypothetical protein